MAEDITMTTHYLQDRALSMEQQRDQTLEDLQHATSQIDTLKLQLQLARGTTPLHPVFIARLEDKPYSCINGVHRVASSFTEAIYTGTLSQHTQAAVFDQFCQAVGPELRDKLKRFQSRVCSAATISDPPSAFREKFKVFAEQTKWYEPNAQIIWPHGHEKCKMSLLMTYPSDSENFVENMKITEQKSSPSIVHLEQLVGDFSDDVFCIDFCPIVSNTRAMGVSSKAMLGLHSREVGQHMLDLNRDLWNALETPVNLVFGEINLERYLALRPVREAISLSDTCTASSQKSPHHLFFELDGNGEIKQVTIPMCHPSTSKHSGAWSADRVNLWDALLDIAFSLIGRPRSGFTFSDSIKNIVFYGGQMRGIKEQTTNDPDLPPVSLADNHWTLSTKAKCNWHNVPVGIHFPSAAQPTPPPISQYKPGGEIVMTLPWNKKKQFSTPVAPVIVGPQTPAASVVVAQPTPAAPFVVAPPSKTPQWVAVEQRAEYLKENPRGPKPKNAARSTDSHRKAPVATPTPTQYPEGQIGGQRLPAPLNSMPTRPSAAKSPSTKSTKPPKPSKSLAPSQPGVGGAGFAYIAPAPIQPGSAMPYPRAVLSTGHFLPWDAATAPSPMVATQERNAASTATPESDLSAESNRPQRKRKRPSRFA